MKRCSWAGSWSEIDPLMVEYHDKEWGVPLHDDRKLFEMLTLEGAQAGLSWSTVLKKRESYRKAFDNFDPAKIARYDGGNVRELLNDKGIIRNRLKIASTIKNAGRFMEIQKEFGSFDRYIWSFVKNKPVVNRFKKLSGVPSKTKLSDLISADLKKRGFTFVGSTIIYAFMQAVGIVLDHTTDCFKYKELTARK